MSEPPAKIVKLDYASSSRLLSQKRMNKNDVEFFVIVCHDVLIEVLQCGNRRQLVKLERIGRRYHRIIEAFLGEKPFLRLNLRLKTGHKLEAQICSGTRTSDWISHQTLTDFPHFLRFYRVELFYHSGTQSFEKKCQLFVKLLQQLKEALKESNLIRFGAIIQQQMLNQFKDHSALLDHVRNELLPICDTSHQYAFEIAFLSNQNADRATIESILQIPLIIRCTNVSIQIYGTSRPTHLPVESISNWLNGTVEEGTKIGGQKQREKLLRLGEWIQNTREMIDYLKERFTQANFPVIPFTLKIDESEDVKEIGGQKLANEETDEEFLVVSGRLSYIFGAPRISIKRSGAKKTKNAKVSANQ